MLDRIERIGNALPHPASLFLIGALAVMALSQIALVLDWSVEKDVTRIVRTPVLGADGRPLVDPLSGEALGVAVIDARTGAPQLERVRTVIRPVGLLSSEGLYWSLYSLVDNFKNFPPLAIVLVGMLGIGLAERTGFIGALLKATLLGMPQALLTPSVFFVGVLSSMALDAGYVVLPPVAAALYKAVGRSPLVGLGAVFAGVSAGFSANLFITGIDPLLAGLSEAGARILDPNYSVAATSNWWFMIASTLLLTLLGWAVTDLWVEPRYHSKPPEEGGAEAPADSALDERSGSAQRLSADAETLSLDAETLSLDAQRLSPLERRGLGAAVAAVVVGLVLVVVAVLLPGAPLHGMQGKFSRWVASIVPLIFLGFFLPGLVYGITTGILRSDKDAARLLGETMAAMGPYIVMAFFAAQFIEYFRHSNLGEMLAISGGTLLARADLPSTALVAAFIGVVMVGNLFIGSMSAKYAFFAPVFVPMFMQVGVSPELTQAAYRVGDSVTNVITPLNPYVVIILVFMQRYVPRAGIGSLVSLMLPYTLVFGVLWTALLLVWMAVGASLGPAGPLVYSP